MYKKRPGIILAPGGVYLIHATREKEGVALEFVAKGYNVFFLEYSLGFSSREVKESVKKLSFNPSEGELKVSGMVLCYPLINPSPDRDLELTDPNNLDTKLMKEFLYQTQSPLFLHYRSKASIANIIYMNMEVMALAWQTKFMHEMKERYSLILQPGPGM